MSILSAIAIVICALSVGPAGALANEPDLRSLDAVRAESSDIVDLDATSVAAVENTGHVVVCGICRGSHLKGPATEVQLWSTAPLNCLSKMEIPTSTGIRTSGRARGTKIVVVSTNDIEAQKNLFRETIVGLDPGTIYVFDCEHERLRVAGTQTIPHGLLFAFPKTYDDEHCVVGIVTGGETKIELIDVMSKKAVTTLETGWQRLVMSNGTISNDATTIAVGRNFRSDDETELGVWKLGTGRGRTIISENGGRITAVDFSGDGSKIAVGTSLGAVLVRTATDGSRELARRYSVPASLNGQSIWRLAMSDHRKEILALVGSSAIVGWDLDTSVLRFLIADSHITSFTFFERKREVIVLTDAPLGGTRLTRWTLQDEIGKPR